MMHLHWYTEVSNNIINTTSMDGFYVCSRMKRCRCGASKVWVRGTKTS